MMRLPKVMRGRKAWIGVVAVMVLIAAGVIGVFSASGTSPSFVQNCLALHPGATDEKLALLEAECKVRETASAGVTPAQVEQAKARFRARPPRPNGPPPTRITGLVTSSGVPIGRNQTFHATGHWTGAVGGQWYLVYAGSKVDPATNENSRSALLVYQEPANVNGGEESKYIGAYAPPSGGREPLTITSASGSVLAIQTSTGATLSFDMSARAFK